MYYGTVAPFDPVPDFLTAHNAPIQSLNSILKMYSMAYPTFASGKRISYRRGAKDRSEFKESRLLKTNLKLFLAARSCLLEVAECVNVPSTRKYKVSSRLVLGASTRKEKRV